MDAGQEVLIPSPITRGEVGREFQAFNPTRKPAWRAERVKTLLERKPTVGKPSRTWDDHWVVQWYRMSKAIQEIKPNDRKKSDRKLYCQYPEAYYAYLISNSGDKEMQAILQARILAGQTDREIAKELGTIPGAIDFYERVFFNVRDRLNSRSWIMRQVIGPVALRTGDATETLDPHRQGICWQLFGYFGGSEALDFLLFGMNHLLPPQNPGEAAEWTRQVAEAALQRKVAMASHVMEVTKYNVARVLELGLKLREISLMEESSATGGNRDRKLEEIVTAFVASAQPKIGKAGYKELEAEEGLPINLPLELRAHEMNGEVNLEQATLRLRQQLDPAIKRLNVATRLTSEPAQEKPSVPVSP